MKWRRRERAAPEARVDVNGTNAASQSIPFDMLVCCADGRTSHFIYVYTLRLQLSIISVNCHAQQIKSIEKFKFCAFTVVGGARFVGT